MQVWSRIEWQVGNVARTRVSEYWHRVRRLTGVSTRADLCSSRVSESCVHLESLHFKTGAVFSTDYLVLERVNETRAWGRVHCHVWRRRTKASVVDNRKGFFFFPSQLWLDRVPIWLGKSHFQQQVGWGTRLVVATSQASWPSVKHCPRFCAWSLVAGPAAAELNS